MKEYLFLDNNSIDVINENFKLFKQLNKHYKYCISPSVLEELANIPDNKKETRIKNLITLLEMQPKFIYDSVFVLDYSRLDCACLGDGKVYKEILNSSNTNIRDAIIADTAVNNKCILFTEDSRLYNKMRKLNYRCVNLNDLKNVLEGLNE